MKIHELFDLSGRVAIVTGGGTGLGRQLGEGLAEAGANLVLCSRRQEVCEKASNELSKLGVKTLPLKTNVLKVHDVNEMVEKTISEFGRIDILVNNAGMGWAGAPEELKLRDWSKVLDLNVTGTFLCCRAVGRVMIKQKKGKIINIASVAGFFGTDSEVLDTISYNTSKGAIVTFTKDLAVKWAKHNIYVNAIAPSFFPTHLTDWIVKHRYDELMARTPLKRLGGSDDLKGPVVLLASDASNYMTGHTLLVDGGMGAYL